MVANQLGFATMGSNVLKAEIPVGWHTGKHRHGEESMHILEGEGFSIIAGQRFDWHKSSTLQIPYWAEHQHFNTGDVPVLMISGDGVRSGTLRARRAARADRNVRAERSRRCSPRCRPQTVSITPTARAR